MKARVISEVTRLELSADGHGAYATMSVSVCLSVCLSVTEVHWRIIANLGLKFRSKFTAHCGRAGRGNLNNISRYASHC